MCRLFLLKGVDPMLNNFYPWLLSLAQLKAQQILAILTVVNLLPMPSSPGLATHS